MSCYNIQDSRFLFKYSTISGETPTIPTSDDHTDGTWIPTDLYVGEFFLNAADNAMWVRTISGIVPITSGTTNINVTSFVNKSGDTMTGQLNVPTLSGGTISGDTIYSPHFEGTFYGDGSNLTGITATIFTGGTVSGNTTFLGDVDLCNANLTLQQITSCGGVIQISGDTEIVGSLSATTFYGDGSGLTNLTIPTVSLTLGQVLVNGNTTDANDILLTGNPLGGGDSDSIKLDGNDIESRFTFEYDSGNTWYPKMISEDSSGANQSVITLTPYVSYFQVSENILGSDRVSRLDLQPNNILLSAYNIGDGIGVEHIITETGHTINGGGLFGGIKYGANYSSQYTNRSLVDKEYVDNAVSGATPTLGLPDVLTNDNTTGANDIIVDEGQGVKHGSSTDLGIVFTADTVFTDLKRIQIKGDSNGGYGLVGVDNSLGIETIVRLQTRNSDAYGADIFMIQGDNNITMVTQDNVGEFAQFDITPGVMIISNPSNINGTPGLQYDDDYSSTFNDRTLVDKQYVDNKILNGLTDTDGTRTDNVRASIVNGTGIFSEAGSEGSKVEVSDINVTIQSAINGYTGTSVVDSEIVYRHTEEGTPGTTGYMKVEDGLYLQSKQTTYTEDTGYGSDNKLRVTEFVINKYIDQYSGTLDLFYEPFDQEDLMDYEVEVYMKNSDTYYAQRRYMVWKMKRSCVYDNYNVSYDISPTDIQKYDYGFDPAYDSWDIVRENDYPFGVKWRMDWDFGNYVDYSITIKLKVTYKKY